MKPRIRLLYGRWLCESNEQISFGDSPNDAYSNFILLYKTWNRSKSYITAGLGQPKTCQ